MKILSHSIWLCRFIVFGLMFSCFGAEYDVTIVGRVYDADGLCRIPVNLIDMLKDDLKINHVPLFGSPITTEANDQVKSIFNNPDKTPGTISILVDGLGTPECPSHLCVPESRIKLAYSMFETDLVPPVWVKILNQHFDAVIVPDPFLIDCYRNSGVVIPIFELPLAINLDDFLNSPRLAKPHFPFVFGNTAGASSHKNQTLLIQAFAEEFGDTEEVVLRLNSRWGCVEALSACKELIQKYDFKNITHTVKVMSNKQYRDTLASFDCYVNISKGEGYSIGPREALALGIPCILTNNTAQKTLCKSGLVRAVPADILEPLPESYGVFFEDVMQGSFFNCTLEDVKAALRDVYTNYDFYLNAAKNGPNWVSQYHLQKLKSRYLNLFKPTQVILGRKNEITSEYLMTNSKELYNKYQSIEPK